LTRTAEAEECVKLPSTIVLVFSLYFKDINGRGIGIIFFTFTKRNFQNFPQGRYSRSTCVKKKVCWASEIEWPVIKHSRDKKINKG
jgi:hypothetical protein